jgi:hypothetical protein
MNTLDDIELFIKQEKRQELTHKYANALTILDWDYKRRSSISLFY